MNDRIYPHACGSCDSTASNANLAQSPPTDAYSPSNGGYGSQNGAYTPPNGAYTPPNGAYTPPNGAYTPPYADAYHPHQQVQDSPQTTPPPYEQSASTYLGTDCQNYGLQTEYYGDAYPMEGNEYSQAMQSHADAGINSTYTQHQLHAYYRNQFYASSDVQQNTANTATANNACSQAPNSQAPSAMVDYGSTGSLAVDHSNSDR